MRFDTQTVLPSADTAAMLFWALLASGQINMRKVDGWQTLAVVIAMPTLALIYYGLNFAALANTRR